MAFVIADRVKETTTTTGTGTITLGGAATGFQSFAVIGDTNTTYYTIVAQVGTEWEVGIGTYTSSGTTLARTTVLSNSSGTQPSALNFSAGIKDVFVTYPAEKSVNLNASDVAVIPTLNLTNALGAAYGGTGVANNAAMTVTGSGNFAYTRTLTGATNVTFPTTGTLSTLAGSETLTNKTIAYGSNTLTDVVGVTATQTLTNKTLTAPIIATISNTGTLTLPTSTDTLVGRATTDTLTNKTLTSPVLTTPQLGTPSQGVLSSCTVDGTDAVGFLNIPQNSQSAAYTLVLADAGKHIFHPSTDANARTYTIPANSSVAYPIGTAITFINMTSQVVTIAITSDTMYLSSAGTTGSRSLAQYGSATAIKMTSTTWLISGSGLT